MIRQVMDKRMNISFIRLQFQINFVLVASMKFRELPFGEEASAKFSQNRVLLPSEWKCTKGHQMKLSFGETSQWRCMRAECGHKVRMRVGNWFADSKPSSCSFTSERRSGHQSSGAWNNWTWS